jgi:hypothetical protein
MKETFLMCGEWEKHLSLLTDEQAGRLLKAVFAYQNRGEDPSCDPLVQMAFSFMQSFFDESNSRYAEKVKANQENGKRGGRPKKGEGYLGNPKNPVGFSITQDNPKEPNKTLSESESEYDSDSVPPNGGAKARAGKPRFTPPTLAEVSAYVSERHSPVVPQEFIDFYAAKGWMVGKTPMKDWKAACRNAENWDRWKQAPNKKDPRSSYYGGSQDPDRLRADMDRMDRLLERTSHGD